MVQILKKAAEYESFILTLAKYEKKSRFFKSFPVKFIPTSKLSKLKNAVINMTKNDKINIQDIEDYILHCDGSAFLKRRGHWFLNEVYKSNPENRKKAALKLLKTLRRINKARLDKETEFILIDRVYELNYRVLGQYLIRKTKKDVLEDLQKINIFVQGIICGDVKNLDRHYELNKKT